MVKRYLVAVSFVIVVLVIGGIFLATLYQGQAPTSNLPTQYTYKIIKTYPHDTSAYTEGLIFDNGSLFESTGKVGTSYLRCVDLKTGVVLQQANLADDLFGEGLALVNGSFVQLTWLNHIGFVYDRDMFDLKGNFSYDREGWGLTFDGANLIMTDGSSNLYFLDPVTYETVGQVTVNAGNSSVVNLNELEYIKGDVYANVWLTQKIAIINPQTGQVKGWIDLTGIYHSSDPDTVLNGIAYDEQNDRLFVTGKYWPSLYEIEISPAI